MKKCGNIIKAEARVLNSGSKDSFITTETKNTLIHKNCKI